MGRSIDARVHWNAYERLAPNGEWVELARNFRLILRTVIAAGPRTPSGRTFRGTPLRQPEVSRTSGRRPAARREQQMAVGACRVFGAEFLSIACHAESAWCCVREGVQAPLGAALEQPVGMYTVQRRRARSLVMIASAASRNAVGLEADAEAM